MAGLRWDAISQDGTLMLARHKTSARSGPKQVPIGEELQIVLDHARLVVRDLAAAQSTLRLRDALLQSPYVFPSVARNAIGRPIGRILDDTWVTVRCLAALPNSMTIHGIRGAFITQAQRLGIPVATVAAMVGHESPLTTLKHYTAPTLNEVAEDARRVSGWIASRGSARTKDGTT
jgi:integrase